jgi:hypothetical protein
MQVSIDGMVAAQTGHHFIWSLPKDITAPLL